jgi:hypothetical protein
MELGSGATNVAIVTESCDTSSAPPTSATGEAVGCGGGVAWLTSMIDQTCLWVGALCTALPEPLDTVRYEATS